MLLTSMNKWNEMNSKDTFIIKQIQWANCKKYKCKHLKLKQNYIKFEAEKNTLVTRKKKWERIIRTHQNCIVYIVDIVDGNYG